MRSVDAKNALFMGAHMPFSSLADLIMSFATGLSDSNQANIRDFLGTFMGGGISVTFVLGEMTFVDIDELKPSYLSNINYFSS
mmetsp:Transcript_130494/g.194290  ORF Transcript_130494/g.194290 Transcript_130494/m.194290 type:complete len:83 (-) Transcript_130494:2130-2378(-)